MEPHDYGIHSAAESQQTEPGQDPAELVVFNMANVSSPGGLTLIDPEDGVQAFL